MRVYALIARLTFRRFSTYRAAVLGGIGANTVFGVVKAFILTAVWHTKPNIGGYDLSDALTYTFLGQALIEPMAMFGGGFDLAERIRTGDVATDLFRPVDFQAYWLAQDFGRASFGLFSRGLVPFTVGALIFPLRIPTDPRLWAAFLLAFVFGLCVSFAIRYLVALTVFWLMDDKGVNGIVVTTGQVLSGMIMPLVMFPSALGALARALPFASVLQVPADVLLGKRTGTALLGAYAFEIAWAVALLAAGRYITLLARRKVVAQGG